MPVIPYRTKARRLKAQVLSKPQIEAVKKIAVATSRQMSDKKQKTVQVDRISALHQNTYVFNPLFAITAGVQSDNRIGQYIYLERMIVRFNFESANNPTIGMPVFRVRVYRDSDNTFTSTSTFTTVTEANQDSVGFTSNNQNNLCVANDKYAVTAIKDIIYPVPTYSATGKFHRTGMVNIPFNKRMLYDDDGFMKDENIYVSISAHLPGTSSGTTSVGNVQCTYSLYFSE